MERPKRVVNDSSLLEQALRSEDLSLNETRSETRYNPDSSRRGRGRNRTKFSRHKYWKLSAEQKESYHKHLLSECFQSFPKVKYGLRMENETTDLGCQTPSNEINRENIEGNISAVRKSLSNRCFRDEIPTKEFAENAHRELSSTCHKALTSQCSQIPLSGQSTAQYPNSLLLDLQAASLKERVDVIEIHLAKLEELGYFRSREINDYSTSPITNQTSSSIGEKELSPVSIIDTGRIEISNRQQNPDIECIQMKVIHAIDKYLSEGLTKMALSLSNNESLSDSPKSESISTSKKNNFQVSDDAQCEENYYLPETRKGVQCSSEVNGQRGCIDFSNKNFIRAQQFSLDSHSQTESLRCDSRRQFPFTERKEYYQQPERCNWVFSNNQPIINSQTRICSKEAYNLWWCRLTEAENENLPMIYTFTREEWICNIPSDATERFIIVAETVNRHSHNNIRLLEYSTRFSEARNIYQVSANSSHLVVLLKYNINNDWHVTVVLRSVPCANNIFNEILGMNGTPDSEQHAPAYFQLIKLRSENGTSEDQVDILSEPRAVCDPIVQTFDLEIVTEETILMQKNYEKLKDIFNHIQPTPEQRNAQNVCPENLYDMKLKTKSNRKLVFFEELEENELNDLAQREKSLKNSECFLKQNCEFLSSELLKIKSYSKEKNSGYMFGDKFSKTDFADHAIYKPVEIASEYILQNEPPKMQCLSEAKCLLHELQTEKELTIKNYNFSDDTVNLQQPRNTSKSQENGHQEFSQDNEVASGNVPVSEEVKESPEISFESKVEICRPIIQNTPVQCKSVTTRNMYSHEKSLTVSPENLINQSVEILTEKTSPSRLKLNELQNKVELSSECYPSTHKEAEKRMKNKNNSVTYCENTLQNICNNTATCYLVETEKYDKSIAVKIEDQSQTIKAELNCNYEASSLIRTLSAETAIQKETGIEIENGTATIQNTPIETTKYINERNMTKDHLSVLQLKEELDSTNEHKCDLTHSSKKRNIHIEETISLPAIIKLPSNSSETMVKTVTEISLSRIIERSTVLDENAEVFCRNNCSEEGVTSATGSLVNIGESEFPKCLQIPKEIIPAKKEETQIIQRMPVKELEQSNFEHCKNNVQHQYSSVRDVSKSTCESFPLKRSENGNRDVCFQSLCTELAPENKELSESYTSSNELPTPTQTDETKMTNTNNQDAIPDSFSTKSFNKISNSDTAEHSNICSGIVKSMYLHSTRTLEENLESNETASHKSDSKSSTPNSKVTTKETKSVKNTSFDQENMSIGKSEQQVISSNMKDRSASLFTRKRNSKSHDCNIQMANTKQSEHTFPVSSVEPTEIHKNITSSSQREDLPIGAEQRETLKLHTDLMRRGLEKSSHSLSSDQTDTSESMNKLTKTSVHDRKRVISVKCKELDSDIFAPTDYLEQTVQHFKGPLKVCGNAEMSQTYCKQILTTLNDMTDETASKPEKVAEITNEKIVKIQSPAKLVETKLSKNDSSQAENQTVLNIENTQNFNTTELCQETPNDLKQKLEGASASILITEMITPKGEPMNSINILTPNINKRPGPHAVNINQPKDIIQRAELIQPGVRMPSRCAAETHHKDSTQHLETKSSVEKIDITSKSAVNHIHQTPRILEMTHTMNISDNIKGEMANLKVKQPFSLDTNFLEKSLGNREERIPSDNEIISVITVEKEVPSKFAYTDQKSTASSEKENSVLTSDKQLLLFTIDKSCCKKGLTESSKDYGNQVITSVPSEMSSLDKLVVGSDPLLKEQFSSDYGITDSSNIQQSKKYTVTKEHGEFTSNKDKGLVVTVNEIQKSSILPHKPLGTINHTLGLQCNIEITDHTLSNNNIESKIDKQPFEIETFDINLETQQTVNTVDDFQMPTNVLCSEEYSNQSKISVNLRQGPSKLQKKSTPVTSSTTSINKLPIIFINTENYENQTNAEKEVLSIINNNSNNNNINNINNSEIALKIDQVNSIQESYSNCSQKNNSEFPERESISPKEKPNKFKMVNSQGVGIQRSLRRTEYEEQSSSTITALSPLPSMKINENICNSDSTMIDMQEMGDTSMDLLDYLQLKEKRTFCKPQPLLTSLVQKPSSISVDQKSNLNSQPKNVGAVEDKTLGFDTKHPGNKKLSTILAQGEQLLSQTPSSSTSVDQKYNANLQPKTIADNEDKELNSDAKNPGNKLPTTIPQGAESRLKTPSQSTSDNNREITLRNQTSTKPSFQKNLPLVSNTVISTQQRVSDSVEYKIDSKNLKDNKFHSLSESPNSQTSSRLEISDRNVIGSTAFRSQLQSTSKPETETSDDCKRDTHTVCLKGTSTKGPGDGNESWANTKAVNNSLDTKLPMRIPLDLKQLPIASQGAKTAEATKSSLKFDKLSKKISPRDENKASNLIEGKSRTFDPLQTGKCSDVNVKPAAPVKENSQIGDNYNRSTITSKEPTAQSKLVTNTFKNTKQCTTFVQSNTVSSSYVKVSSKDFRDEQMVSREQNTSKCKMESKAPKKS